MERHANIRIASALIGLALLAGCLGCGWSSPESKHLTQTGLSESGYPKGSPIDSGSPALASQRRPGKKKTEAK